MQQNIASLEATFQIVHRNKSWFAFGSFFCCFENLKLSRSKNKISVFENLKLCRKQTFRAERKNWAGLQPEADSGDIACVFWKKSHMQQERRDISKIWMSTRLDFVNFKHWCCAVTNSVFFEKWQMRNKKPRKNKPSKKRRQNFRDIRTCTLSQDDKEFKHLHWQY